MITFCQDLAQNYQECGGRRSIIEKKNILARIYAFCAGGQFDDDFYKIRAAKIVHFWWGNISS
jgi:hypothetical protein